MPELEIKCWETSPITFNKFYNVVMNFAAQNGVTTADVKVEPFIETEYDTVIMMGFRFTIGD